MKKSTPSYLLLCSLVLTGILHTTSVQAGYNPNEGMPSFTDPIPTTLPGETVPPPNLELPPLPNFENMPILPLPKITADASTNTPIVPIRTTPKGETTLKDVENTAEQGKALGEYNYTQTIVAKEQYKTFTEHISQAHDAIKNLQKTDENLGTTMLAVANAVDTMDKQQTAAITSLGQTTEKLNQALDHTTANTKELGSAVLNLAQTVDRNQLEENKQITALNTQTETLADKISDINFGLKNIRANKADAATVNEQLAALNTTLANNHKIHKQNEKILNRNLNTKVATETYNQDLAKQQQIDTTQNTKLAELNDHSQELGSALLNMAKTMDNSTAAQNKINENHAAVQGELGASVLSLAQAVDEANAVQDTNLAKLNKEVSENSQSISTNSDNISSHSYYINHLLETLTKNINNSPVKRTRRSVESFDQKLQRLTEAMYHKDEEHQKIIEQLENTNTRQDQELNLLQEDLGRTGAASAALAALKPLYHDARSQVMVGAGHYRGKNSLALGLAYYPNRDILTHFGSTITDKHAMVNAGISIAFGKGKTPGNNEEIAALKTRIAHLEEAIQKLIANK